MAWFNESWDHRREVTVDNTGGAAKSNYAVKIELTSANFDFTEAQSDGADVRITDSDETTLIDHWIEAWDSVGETATVWAEVPSIGAGASATIYLYYGNAVAESASSGADTFLLFEGFGIDSLRGDISVVDSTGLELGNVNGNDNPVIQSGGGGWRNDGVREPSNGIYRTTDPSGSPVAAGEEYVLLVSGVDASDNVDLGVLFSADGVTWVEHGSNPVVDLAEDPHIAVNTDGSPYHDGTHHYVYFERKAAGNSNSQNDVGVARTQDFKTWQVWDGDSWETPSGANHAIVLPGTATEWDANFTASPTVVHDGTQFVIMYEGDGAGGFQTGVARGANPEGPFTKEATNPVASLEVCDDLILLGGTWYLSGHGSAAPPEIWSSTDSPANWDDTSFSVIETGFMAEVASSGIKGVPVESAVGRRFITQDSNRNRFDIVDVFNGEWAFRRNGTNEVYADLIYVNADGQLVLQPEDVNDLQGISAVASTSFTADFEIMARRKSEDQTDNQETTLGFGSGSHLIVNVPPLTYDLPALTDSFMAVVFEPGGSVQLQLRKYANDDFDSVVATGSISDAEAKALAVHALRYLSDGTLTYFYNGNSRASAIDSAFVANSNVVLIAQGGKETRPPAKTTWDWLVVRPCDGDDPAQTVGTQEDVPSAVDPTNLQAVVDGSDVTLTWDPSF